MKSSRLASAALLALFAPLATMATMACGGDDQPPPVTPAPTATAPVATVDPNAVDAAPPPPPKPSMIDVQTAFEKNQLAVWNDTAKTAALHAPDGTLWIPGNPALKGTDAIAKDHQGLLDAYPNTTMTDGRMWLKGNTIVTQWVMNATDKATSKPVSVQGLTIQTLNDDGLVMTEHTYVDFETFAKQTGAYKSGDPAAPMVPAPTSLETHIARNDANETANAASIDALSAAWLKKDDKAVLAMNSDDVQLIDYSGDAVPHDKKHFAAGLAAFRKAVDETALKDTNVIAVEDFTIDEQEFTVTQKAAYSFGKVKIPNTKKTATLHSVDVAQWKDGKIIKDSTFANAMELDAAFGIGMAAPAPAAKAAKPATKKAAAARL